MIEKIEIKDNLSRRITIKNLLGIHARPAAKIADIVKNAKKNVWISTQNNKVDAGSILDILTLGGSKGTKIVIEIETSEDTGILTLLCDLFESRFGEEKNNE